MYNGIKWRIAFALEPPIEPMLAKLADTPPIVALLPTREWAEQCALHQR
jgi:hypothetical protein